MWACQIMDRAERRGTVQECKDRVTYMDSISDSFPETVLSNAAAASVKCTPSLSDSFSYTPKTKP